MGAELELAAGESDEDVELTPQQIAALDKLEQLGAEMRSGPDEPYSSDPQVRALQLVAEGRLGGPGRGQGRKRKPRAAEVVAERVRKSAHKIADAIDDALGSENDNIRLKAADMAIRIERDEATLQMKEDEADLDNSTKEELVFALIRLSSDPATAAQLESVIDIPESDIEEVESVNTGDSSYNGAAKAPRNGTASTAPKARPHKRAARANGRAAAPRDRVQAANPFTAAAARRSSD